MDNNTGIWWGGLVWAIVLLTGFGSCTYCCYIDTTVWGPERERQARLAKQKEIQQCKAEGGAWTWGYLPWGIHGTTIKVEFCQKKSGH